MNIKHQELELERLEFKIKSKADLEILTGRVLLLSKERTA